MNNASRRAQLDSEDYDEFVRDTVNFLAYMAEPIRGFEGRKLGKSGCSFILIFFLIIARMLKKQIWKDVKLMAVVRQQAFSNDAILATD